MSLSKSLDGVSLDAMSVDASINSKTCHDKETLVKLLSLPSPNRMAPRTSELNLRPSNVKHADSILYQYGCCVLKSSLEPKFLEEWLQKMKQIPITSLYQAEPYDNTHFTYGGCKLLPHEYYVRLEEDNALLELCHEVLSPGWMFGKRSGDLVTRNTSSSQLLHSDWTEYPMNSMALGYGLVVSLALHDIPAEQAALRIVPWCFANYDMEPYQNEEDGKLCGFQVPLAKGEMLIRDCRMAHSGMPNKTNNDRVLPGIQILTAEWLASDRSI